MEAPTTREILVNLRATNLNAIPSELAATGFRLDKAREVVGELRESDIGPLR